MRVVLKHAPGRSIRSVAVLALLALAPGAIALSSDGSPAEEPAEFRAYDAMSLPHFIQSPMVPGGSAAARSGGLRRRRAKRPAVVAGGEAACGAAENCGGANGRVWERSARGPPRR